MINKNKLIPQNIIDFFKSKPVFDKSETDASIKYGWPSTKGGLYSITDIYKHFEAKGYNQKNIDDVLEKFQSQDAFSFNICKLEKGKVDFIYLLRIKTHNPDYASNPYFIYYCYDLTKEEGSKLKKEYEEESLILMKDSINRNKNSVKNISISKANRKAKITKPRVKKPAFINI